MKAVTVIGIGDNGCSGLTSVAFGIIQRAQILVGGERHLEFFPDFHGQKIMLQGNLSGVIEKIKEFSLENNVVVLASGDPLFFGIGGILSKKLDRRHLEFIPNLSSIQLAFAKIGENWNEAKVISLHGRKIQGLVNKIQHHSLFALFTDEENSPLRIVDYLQEFKEINWTIFVCENLGGVDERVTSFDLDSEIGRERKQYSQLNVVILKRKGDFLPPAFSIRDESLFQKRLPKKGLITKKEIRALSIVNLNLRRDSIVWDIGAGSGSVSIEAAKIAYEGEVHACECDPIGIEIINENIQGFKTDNVLVYHGMAPGILPQLPDPDAVFIGGSKGNLKEIINQSISRLKVGGRLVVSAITFENVQNSYEIFRSLGIMPEVQLVQISRGEKLATYLRYEALNPIHLFTITKNKLDKLNEK